MDKPSFTPGVTIDGPFSRDLDDAIWLEMRDGQPRLTVSLANVAAKVAAGSELDLQARRHGATRYFAQGSDPMLPPRLSEHRLSLVEGRPRGAFVVKMRLDQGLELEKVSLRLGAGQSAARLTHDGVASMLAEPSEHPLRPMLGELSQLALSLLEKRRQRGALAVYDVNQGWGINEDGQLVALADIEANIGYVIVQECMVLANQAVAEFMVKAGIPGLFRNHRARVAAPDRVSLLADIQDATRRPDIFPLETLRQRVNLLMGRANYGPTLEGHYALNLPAYTHFTSALRRYADLVNQRAVLAFLKGQPQPHPAEEVAEIAAHLNATDEQRREKERQHDREWAIRTADRKLQQHSPEVVALMAKNHFYPMLKGAVGGPSDELAAAYRLRLQASRMELKELNHVLFRGGAGWDALRLETLDWIDRHPHLSVSLVTSGANLQGWSVPEYDYAKHGDGFLCTAKTVHRGQEFNAIGEGPRKQAAQQRAAFRLCERLALAHDAALTP